MEPFQQFILIDHWSTKKWNDFILQFYYTISVHQMTRYGNREQVTGQGSEDKVFQNLDRIFDSWENRISKTTLVQQNNALDDRMHALCIHSYFLNIPQKALS